MIYLDNAATSFPKAPGTAEAVNRFLTEIGANSGRASHSQARKSGSIMFECRELLAELLGVKNSDRIIFTSNTTEALNKAILGMIRTGDTVLTSSIEHNSVMRPLNYLQKTKGIRIIKFGADPAGFPDMDDFRSGLREKPDLLVFNAASNVTGVIAPYREMALEASGKGIPVCVDGAQLTGSREIELEDSRIDLFAFPGHKGLMGPTGTGGLYISEKVEPEPVIFGGTGSRSAEELQPEFLPDKYESGTPNIAGIAGLLASAEFISEEGISRIEKREKELTEYLIKELSSIDSITVYADMKKHDHTAAVSFTSSSMNVSDITRVLDQNDIAVRMGMHCSPAAHKAIGTFESGGTVRLSPGYFTEEKEIEDTVRVLKEIL